MTGDSEKTRSIIVNATDLKCVLFLNSIIDKKSPYNAIKNIRIQKYTEDELKLTATNLEIFIIKNIKAQTINNINEIKIKSNILCDCLKKISGDVEFQLDGNKVNIIDKKGKFSIVNCDEKYPEDNFGDMELNGIIDEKIFLDIVKSVNIDVSTQEKGVCKIIIQDGFMTIVVFDRKRICFNTIIMKEHIQDKIFLISPKYLKELKKIKGDVKIYNTDSKIMIDNSEGKIILKTIEGSDIDYMKFINDIDECCQISLKELKNAVERCLITSSELIKNIFLEFNASNLKISGYDPVIGLGYVNIKINTNFCDQISLNGEDLLDILNCCQNDFLVIYKSKNDRDIIIRNDNAYYILAKLVLKTFIPTIEDSGAIVKVNAEKIYEICENLDVIIDKKSPYAAIRNIRLQSIQNNELKLTSTNLEIFIIKNLNIECINQIPEIKIKSNILCSCLKQLSGNIELKIENNKLHIVDEKGKFALLNCEDKYPDEDFGNMEPNGIIEDKKFINLIKSVSINVTQQDKGACKIIIKNNELTIVVFDRKRICFNSAILEEYHKDISLMISPKYLKELKKINGKITISSINKKIMLSDDHGKIVLKTIENNDIDHLRFINNLGDFCEVMLSDLKDAVERCLINIQSNSINRLKFQCFDSYITISYFDFIEDTYASQTIPATCHIKFENENDRIFQLNGLHILDMIKEMQDEKVYIYFKPDVREVVFKNLAWYVNIKLIQIK